MTEDDLKVIEARARSASFLVGVEENDEELGRTQHLLSTDAPALIAEVRRLQKDLAIAQRSSWTGM
jgi:hypothetical protein